MKKNILQIMPEFGLAGAEIMCENLCYQIQDSSKYNLYVASLYDFHSPITERMEKKGLKIIYLGKKQGLDLGVFVKLYRIIKLYKIDIVHTHRYVLLYAILPSIIARVKVRVHTIHNIATMEVNGYRRKLSYFLFKNCGVIPVSISPLVQKTVIKEYNLTESQTPLIYNGVDLSSCLIKDNYVASEPFRFVHIGRFNPQKNHELIISAAEVLMNEGYRFTINLIGGAGNEKQREEEVNNKGLDKVILFSGLQSNVYPFLKESDCFILPSKYEGMPVTLIEAMGCGLPIIASEVGGVPDMIANEESGLLIHATIKELVFAMKRVMADERLREKLGSCALANSKRFTSRAMFEGYDKVYSDNK